MTEDIAARLKAEWFARFDEILENGKTIPSSNLKCLELCEARCCARVGMREMSAGEIASPVVVLLPFEMEYLIQKTGISRDKFRCWLVPLTPELTIEVGMFDEHPAFSKERPVPVKEQVFILQFFSVSCAGIRLRIKRLDKCRI